MSSDEKIRVGITCGDLNGIGIEIIIKTFLDNRMLDNCIPIVYGSAKTATYHRKSLNINDFSFNFIKNIEQANPKKANLLNLWDEEIKIDLGEPSEVLGKYAVKSLQLATEDLAANKIDVLVTAPVNKHTMQSEKYQFSGQTEYLANYANEENPLMILVSENLRVGLATGHLPVKDVAENISTAKIIAKLRVFNKSLIQDFGIERPKLAVLALNPHAGDNGLIGNEEQDLIIPAIKKANEENILVFGPYAADGFFGSSNFAKFDGILAMYHDQGLTPFKALSFDCGVNFTAGLPIVRTAPDHGVAYDIAGKNIASENSFRQAIFLACDIYRKRKEYRQLTANQLNPAEAKEVT
ncbi:MAG: 4-hydroxythreonine-4-phosphate dehydrogenase PdxA [Flavobacteriales bacterium]|nr:MAG: 4-hydroxythreonine-4-phosphate dehydrogenase PdxA [Flavobacteriales bacterium]